MTTVQKSLLILLVLCVGAGALYKDTPPEPEIASYNSVQESEVVAECANEAKQRDYGFTASLAREGWISMSYSRFIGAAGPDAFRRCMVSHGYSAND